MRKQMNGIIKMPFSAFLWDEIMSLWIDNLVRASDSILFRVRLGMSKLEYEWVRVRPSPEQNIDEFCTFHARVTVSSRPGMSKTEYK